MAPTGAIREAVESDYFAMTPASRSTHERAGRSLVAGTTGNLRHFAPYPLYFDGGAGPFLHDVDGRSYIDCFLANGPLLLGHRPDSVERSVAEHAGDGRLLLNPPLAIEAAEAVVRTVPCAERVRFVNSGTEAVAVAVRIARGHTGRDGVIRFAGHYHGQTDPFLSGLDGTSATFGAGIPQDAAARHIVLPFNDAGAIADVLARRRDVAAILLDPAMHAGGLWGTTTQYLSDVRELADRHGVVLIFDEVITGFRLALGGAQEHYGVTPDLTTLGKALAAGGRLGAVVGRADIMSTVDPMRDGPVVFQSGTANDATEALAACVGAIREYERLATVGEYERLAALTADAVTRIQYALRAIGVPAAFNVLGPMAQMFVPESPPHGHIAGADDVALRATVLLALVNYGLMLSLPSSNHVYLSFAHDAAIVDDMVGAVLAAGDRYRFGDIAPHPDLQAATST
jgi:glutamate-1-semialdehyde 2,1-aminomutase